MITLLQQVKFNPMVKGLSLWYHLQTGILLTGIPSLGRNENYLDAGFFFDGIERNLTLGRVHCPVIWCTIVSIA